MSAERCGLGEGTHQACECVMRRLDVLEAALRVEVLQLQAWAKESRESGWSTHQVDPMQRRAAALALLLLGYGRTP